MIRFTIITCVYNSGSTLGRTLDSVQQQQWPHVEHLILDGRSTDGSWAMAEDYKKYSDDDDGGHEVVAVSEPDSGLYDAMNKGIGMATGDYVLFLNAGDTFPAPDTLEQIAASVGDGEQLPAVLYGDTDIVDGQGRFIRHRRLQPPANGLTWKAFRRGMLVCHQAFYARTDLAKRTLYDLGYRLSADVDWCIRIMKLADAEGLTMKNVGMVVVNYLDGGMTTQNHRASLGERFSIMRRHYGLMTTLGMHAWFVVRSVLAAMRMSRLSNL